MRELAVKWDILGLVSCSTGEEVRQGVKGAKFKEVPVVSARVQASLNFTP